MYANGGFGTQSLATRLTEQGILNRKGQNFHPSTILNMLKNPTYLGIIRSAESRSEPFEHLRIIDDDTWERTQALIEQRSNKYEENRKFPRKIKGKCLLSGNIYCGHCGARLTLTTAGKAYSKVDGSVVPHRYLRYVCYNRTRHKHMCDGQTGYAAKNIDDCVERILIEVFERLRNIPNDGIIEKQYASKLKEAEVGLNRAKKLLSGKTSELADLKGEVVKVIRGTSKWSMELLNEIIANTETEIATLTAEIDALQDECENSEKLFTKLQSQYRSYLDWANTFAASDLGVKKMIASHMIDKISISRGNQIEIDFNISIEQFLGEMEQAAVNDIQAVI